MIKDFVRWSNTMRSRLNEVDTMQNFERCLDDIDDYLGSGDNSRGNKLFSVEEKYRLIAVISGAIGIVGALMFFASPSSVVRSLSFIVMFAGFGLGLYFWFGKANEITEPRKLLDKALYQKALALQYDYRPTKRLTTNLLVHGYGFNTGDTSRYGIYRQNRIKHNGVMQYVFTYCYETRHETTSTDSNGRTTTETSYQTHYIYGMIIPNHYFPEMRVFRRSKFSAFFAEIFLGSRYQPTSPDFNERFGITTKQDNHIPLAKYFTPMRTELMVKHCDIVPSGFSVIVRKRHICITSSKSLIETKHRGSIIGFTQYRKSLLNLKFKYHDDIFRFLNEAMAYQRHEFDKPANIEE